MLMFVAGFLTALASALLGCGASSSFVVLIRGSWMFLEEASVRTSGEPRFRCRSYPGCVLVGLCGGRRNTLRASPSAGRGVSVGDSSGSHSRARGWHIIHQGSRSEGVSGAGSPSVSTRCAVFMSATASWMHAWQTMWCTGLPYLSVPHANGMPSYRSSVCV